MDASNRKTVRERAEKRCEYCRLHQDHLPFVPFHVEHVIAKKHGGTDDLTNLALACDRCNLHKGSNLTGIDPETGKVMQLFHPRIQAWADHFRMEGPRIVGLTSEGRATIQVLNMNTARRLHLRVGLLANQEW